MGVPPDGRNPQSQEDSRDSPEAECRCSPDCAVAPPHHPDFRLTVNPQCQGG